MKQDPWKALQKNIAVHRADSVPDGWMSSIDLASLWNKGRSATNEDIRKLIKCGKIDVKTFKVTRAGRLQDVRHCKIK